MASVRLYWTLQQYWWHRRTFPISTCRSRLRYLEQLQHSLLLRYVARTAANKFTWSLDEEPFLSLHIIQLTEINQKRLPNATSLEDNLTRRQPQQKATSLEDNLTRKQPHQTFSQLNATLPDDDLTRRH